MAWPTSGRTTLQSKKLAQLTRFTDFDVKSLDPGAVQWCSNRPATSTSSIPKPASEHIVNITATGDFPWMMPHWEDVTSRMTQPGALADRQTRVAEARGEIFTVPAEKGDVRNLSHSSGSAEHDPAWSPDGKYISYFSDRSGEYKLVIEPQDGISRRERSRWRIPSITTRRRGRRIRRSSLYTDTDLKVWVLDVATGQTKVVGNDPWMVPQRTLNPVWSPDSKWIAYASRLKSLYHAIFIANAETGETKQVTDAPGGRGMAGWDASGKYLWFLASTDFGLKSQWLDMTSYDHHGELRPVLGGAEERRAESVAAGERRRQGCRRRERIAATREEPHSESPTSPAPRTPVNVQIDFDGIQQRIIAVPGCSRAAVFAAARRRGRNGLLHGGRPSSGQVAGGAARRSRGNTLHRYRLSDRKAATIRAAASPPTTSATTATNWCIVPVPAETWASREAAGDGAPADAIDLPGGCRRQAAPGRRRVD